MQYGRVELEDPPCTDSRRCFVLLLRSFVGYPDVDLVLLFLLVLAHFGRQSCVELNQSGQKNRSITTIRPVSS